MTSRSAPNPLHAVCPYIPKRDVVAATASLRGRLTFPMVRMTFRHERSSYLIDGECIVPVPWMHQVYGRRQSAAVPMLGFRTRSSQLRVRLD